ncbi:MAG: GNAT family protein [Kofleriaceae bacterium]
MKEAPRESRTQRLVIRALAASDAPALAELIRRNEARLVDSFPSTVQILATGADGYIAAREADWQAMRGFWFGIHTDRLIGQVQIKNIDWDLGKCELAYHIDRDHEGQGYAFEAVDDVVKMAFLIRMQKVFLRIVAGNSRSAALAERLGFRREGTLRKEFRIADGTLVDIDYFGRLRSD